MKFIILGCGSSVGVPWITGDWGNCNKKNKFNSRSRCSALIKKGDFSILIDTSPDIRKQLLDNNIKNIDNVLFTHEHADQTSGIFELRPFYWKNKKELNIFANKETLKILQNKYDYCFFGGKGYSPILKGNLVKKNFFLQKGNKKIKIRSFYVDHGEIKSTAYIIEKLAYISDTNGILKKDISKLINLKYLIIDCLKLKSHPSHFNLTESINLSEMVRPKKTILTNLHSDLDYDYLKKSLPKNIIPAYDGMILNF